MDVQGTHILNGRDRPPHADGAGTLAWIIVRRVQLAVGPAPRCIRVAAERGPSSAESAEDRSPARPLRSPSEARRASYVGTEWSELGSFFDSSTGIVRLPRDLEREIVGNWHARVAPVKGTNSFRPPGGSARNRDREGAPAASPRQSVAQRRVTGSLDVGGLAASCKPLRRKRERTDASR